MDDQCLSEAKTDRVLAIYSRLVGGAVLNKADLAQQFHVTQRSIQRDIESLRCFFAEQELPQDIVYDKRSRGYRLIDNAQKKLSNSEVLAVCKILLESRSMVTDEMMPLLDRLIDCCVPEQNKAIVQSLVANERFHYVPPHHGKRLLNGLWEIGQAVRNHQVMEIQYERMKEPKLVTRRVEPVGMGSSASGSNSCTAASSKKFASAIPGLRWRRCWTVCRPRKSWRRTTTAGTWRQRCLEAGSRCG